MKLNKIFLFSTIVISINAFSVESTVIDKEKQLEGNYLENITNNPNLDINKDDNNDSVFNAIKSLDSILSSEDMNELLLSYEKEGGVYSCSEWQPKEENVALNKRFQQYRDCKQNYVIKEGESPELEEKIVRTEIESVEKVGQRDFIVKRELGEWTDWTVVNGVKQKSQTVSIYWASGKYQELTPNVSKEASEIRTTYEK